MGDGGREEEILLAYLIDFNFNTKVAFLFVCMFVYGGVGWFGLVFLQPAVQIFGKESVKNGLYMCKT